MKAHVNYTMYKNEIEYVEKYDEVACALDQLNNHDQLVFKELHKIVDACLDEKVSQKSFEQCIKGMIMHGLVLEKFTNDKKFRIALSPIGEEVHRAIHKNNRHLITAH